MDRCHEIPEECCKILKDEDNNSCATAKKNFYSVSYLSNYQESYMSDKDNFTSKSQSSYAYTSNSNEQQALNVPKPFYSKRSYTGKYSSPSNKICKYFKAGYCKNSSCLFKHITDLKNSNSENFHKKNNGMFESKVYTNRNFKDAKGLPLCKYYKKGFCRNGDLCKFYHQKNITSFNSSNSTQLEKHLSSEVKLNNTGDVKSKAQVIKTVTNVPQNIYDLCSLSEEELSVLRNNELKQLKKRFPNHTEEEHLLMFQFQPTDPDWPFDVRNLHLEAEFPKKYPLEVCKIEVIRNVENIPLLLIKYLNTSIFEWFKKRNEDLKSNGKVEMMFRPFLKWFDKNLEELFISGLKMVQRDMKAREAGIEFVPHEQILSNIESKKCEELSSFKKDAVVPNVSLCAETKEKLLTSVSEQNKGPETCDPARNQGTKILLSNLELTEGAAAMACSKISVSLQCTRCKTTSNLTSQINRDCGKRCEKCSKDIAFNFHPSTLHPYSNVLGIVDLMNCKIIDVILVDCYFLIDCFNCSKQVSVNGINYSQTHKLWCLFCNQKMMVCIGGIKFQASKESMITGIKYTPAKKIAKQKDPVVKEGEPLPQLGACKHYKQSYRWLRFPCCGRIYPCDVCHNEKELDHEMKFASRMLCGFCAKEQQYSRDKPCVLCSSNLTKKSGSHWEGGKGCRNKIQMSREDKQKYAGVAKTTSRKAKTVASSKKK